MKKIDYDSANFWLAVLALATSLVGGLLTPYIMTQVQAEQIQTLKGEATLNRDALSRIERQLGRIEGKLGIGD